MEENTKKTAICKWCGIALPSTHLGPCPKCGKEGKDIFITIKENIMVTDSLKWESRHEFYEKNPKMKWFILLITFGSPFIGFFTSGITGFLIGILLGSLSYFLGPKAITKIREIKQGGS